MSAQRPSDNRVVHPHPQIPPPSTRRPRAGTWVLALLVPFFGGVAFHRMATAQPGAVTPGIPTGVTATDAAAVVSAGAASATPAGRGELVPLELLSDPAYSSLELAWLMLVLATALAGLASAWLLARQVQQADAGTEKMRAVVCIGLVSRAVWKSRRETGEMQQVERELDAAEQSFSLPNGRPLGAPG